VISIEGVSEDTATGITKEVYSATRQRLGKVPETFKIHALSPMALRAMMEFKACFDRFELVDAKLMALAELKAALLIGCPFCIDIISALSRAKGVSDAQRRDLGHYRDSAAFSPLEKLVIEYAEHMSSTPVAIPPELHAELRGQLTAPQLVELTSAIAWENYRARFNHAFGLESEGFDGACQLGGPR